MPELTDDDFRRRPDPAKQLRLAAAGKLAVKRDRGPGTVACAAEHGASVCPVAAVQGKPLVEVFAEEAGEKPKRRGMNKTEAEYAERLERAKKNGFIQYFAFEAVRLRLANGAWFKPDFLVITDRGQIQFREVKGYWREAARVRIKVAAELHPWATFVGVRKKRLRDGGGWEVEAF